MRNALPEDLNDGFAAMIARLAQPGLVKYAQLTDGLRLAIREGKLPSGTRLPTERQLADMLGFSLGTVQRALRDLVAEGLLVRRSGLGTFVAEPRIQLHNPLHCQFLNDDGSGVLPIFPKTVRRWVEHAPGPWAAHLGPPANGYLAIERDFDVAEEFHVRSFFYADPNAVPLLRDADLRSLDGQNLKLLLAEQCRLPVQRVRHLVTQIGMPAEIAKKIGVRPGSRGLRLDALAFGLAGPLYFQQFFIPENSRSMVFE